MQLHGGDPINDDYNNGGNNTISSQQQFYSNNNSQQQISRVPNQNQHPQTPLSRSSHVLLHSSNDQNNNSNNPTDNDEVGGGVVGPPPPRGPPTRRDLFEEIRNGGGHWSQLLRQVFLRLPENVAKEEKEEGPPLDIDGGSENGQFAYVGEVSQDIGAWIDFGSLQPGDIILDVQGQQVGSFYSKLCILRFILCNSLTMLNATA